MRLTWGWMTIMVKGWRLDKQGENRPRGTGTEKVHPRVFLLVYTQTAWWCGLGRKSGSGHRGQRPKKTTQVAIIQAGLCKIAFAYPLHPT